MSNRITLAFADRLWRAQANWTLLSMRVLLVDAEYVMDPDDPDLVESPVATSNLLTSLAVAGGWAKAAAAFFPLIVDPREITGAVIVEDTASLQIPIILLDQVVGLPAYAPNQPFWLGWQESGICRL